MDNLYRACTVPDSLVHCPFNKEHVFAKSRLQQHVIRCSKNYPNHFICPYNALHRFLKKEEFTRHILGCPDADTSFMMSMKYCNPEKHGDLRETPYHYENTRAFNKEFEDWDAEYS